MKKLIKVVTQEVANLIQLNEEVTSLELKNHLITNFPKYIWNRKLVSGLLSYIYDNQLIEGFSRMDNGAYYEYYCEPIKTNRTKLVNFIKKNRTDLVEVTWVTNKGNTRTYELTIGKPFINNAGYINACTTNGDFKQIKPSTVSRVKCNGVVKVLK